MGVFTRLSALNITHVSHVSFGEGKKGESEFGTDKMNTVENLTQQTGGCSEEGRHPCTLQRNVFFGGHGEIEIERVRERERGNGMIGNKMKTNKVHNIMIIGSIFPKKKVFTAFWGK